MYILAFGPLPSASQNDDASTGLVPGLKLTKMRVRTFWTAPYFRKNMNIDAPTMIVDGQGNNEQNNNFSEINVLKLADSRSACRQCRS